MRILTIGFPIDVERRLKGEIWQEVTGPYELDPFLYGQSAEGVYDFDIFIADANRIAENGSAGTPEIGIPIKERIVSGAVLICFAAPKSMGWIGQVDPKPGEGRRLEIEPTRPFNRVLERYRIRASYRAILKLTDDWIILARNTAGAPVAAWKRADKGHIIVLPTFEEPHKVITELFENVLPKLAPHLFEDAVKEAPPEWLLQFPLAAAESIKAEILAIEQHISDLQRQHEEKNC